MRRREFIAGLGNAVAWPVAAHAQQPDRMRRVGVLATGTQLDQTIQPLIVAFREGMAKLG